MTFKLWDKIVNAKILEKFIVFDNKFLHVVVAIHKYKKFFFKLRDVAKRLGWIELSAEPYLYPHTALCSSKYYDYLDVITVDYDIRSWCRCRLGKIPKKYQKKIHTFYIFSVILEGGWFYILECLYGDSYRYVGDALHPNCNILKIAVFSELTRNPNPILSSEDLNSYKYQYNKYPLKNFTSKVMYIGSEISKHLENIEIDSRWHKFMIPILEAAGYVAISNISQSNKICIKKIKKNNNM